MAELFKCPGCAAPLEYEGATMQKCRFCGSNVIVPSGVIRNSSSFGQSGSIEFGDLSALTGTALRVAEIQKLITNGRKIEAIKVFRETFQTGLAEAKDAVEAMERGESVDLRGFSIRTANVSPLRVEVDSAMVKRAAVGVSGTVIAVFGFIALFVVGMFAIFIYTITRVENINIAPTMATPVPRVTETPKTNEPKTLAETLKIGGDGIGAGKFKDNRSVAVTADGRIFSADYQGGRVQSFAPDGSFKLQISADTKRTVDKLVVDRKGTLFVKQGYDVFRFDVETGEARGSIRVDYAADLAIGLDGKLYLPTRKGEIQILNPDGSKARTLQLAAGLNLDRIDQLTVDGAGDLYILDQRNYAVFKLSPDGKLINRFGGRGERSAGRAPKGMFSDLPRGMAVDSQGRLYVLEMERVSIFSPTGAFIDDFKTNQAFAIAIDDSDQVFIASRPFVVAHKMSF
jgi:sugar lactone lactonase YvrE